MTIRVQTDCESCWQNEQSGPRTRIRCQRISLDPSNDSVARESKNNCFLFSFPFSFYLSPLFFVMRLHIASTVSIPNNSKPLLI
jgi:hypothetical protein